MLKKTVFTEQIKATLFSKYSIVFPKVGMSIHTDKKRILGCDGGIDNNIMAVSVLDENRLIPLFLLEVFNQFIRLGEIASNASPPSISEDNLKEIKIPLPPPEVQQQITDECEVVDQETDQAREIITTAEQTIEEKLQVVVNTGYPMKRLEDIAEKLIAGGDVPKNNFSQTKTDKFNIPIFANGVKDKGLYGYTDIAKIKNQA